MRLLVMLTMFFSLVSFAEEIPLIPQKLQPGLRACQLKLGGRGYYLNLCPAGTVMVGVQSLAGTPSIQVLCAKFEVVCE